MASSLTCQGWQKLHFNNYLFRRKKWFLDCTPTTPHYAVSEAGRNFFYAYGNQITSSVQAEIVGTCTMRSIDSSKSESKGAYGKAAIEWEAEKQAQSVQGHDDLSITRGPGGPACHINFLSYWCRTHATNGCQASNEQQLHSIECVNNLTYSK